MFGVREAALKFLSQLSALDSAPVPERQRRQRLASALSGEVSGSRCCEKSN
jgi:hypothetical protein